MTAEQAIADLGLTLPEPAAPVAAYVPTVRTGNLVFVSGQIPIEDGKPVHLGKVGANINIETATLAARQACLQALAAVKAEVGSLESIKRIVRVGVFVASAEGFTDQPKVANGASELLRSIFGEAGRHSRAAVGVAELPLGVCVEVELIAEVD